MAVMYSKLGGCFGETTKLGSLANTDLLALVKGLLERLMTHFGLGSSLGKNPGDCYAYWEGGGPVPWGLALLVTWETLAWEAPGWEASLSG